MIFNVLGPWNLIFLIHILHTDFIFLLTIPENRLLSWKESFSSTFWQKTENMKTKSFIYFIFLLCILLCIRYALSLFRLYSIFYCIILLWGLQALIWVRSSCYFFLTVKKFSKLAGYWQILSIKRITICLHRWVILKFFGKKWKLASGCPRSTMNLSFDVVVFSSWRSSISES